MKRLLIAVVLLFVVAAMFNCRGASASIPPVPEPTPLPAVTVTPEPVVGVTDEDEAPEPGVLPVRLFLPCLGTGR